MIIAISGSSGFIASEIMKSDAFCNAEFLFLKRNETDDAWLAKLQRSDVVINLAGAPIIKRWTRQNMLNILNSRVNTTKRLVALINGSKTKPDLFISGSAIGIYPAIGDKTMTESSFERGDGFLTDVVQQWENAAQGLNSSSTRLVIARIGVVIGTGGGLLKKTIPLFKLGLGGKIASGQQALSFIHIDDIVGAMKFFIENDATQGTYNLVAPNLTTNADFTEVLAKKLGRPAFFRVPAFALKMIYGKAAEIMINGEKVYPQRLIEAEFKFKYPTIQEAILNRTHVIY